MIRERLRAVPLPEAIGPAVLAVYVPFALGGLVADAGLVGRVLFALIYAVSAVSTPWLLIALRRSLADHDRMRAFALVPSLLLALAAISHLSEAGLVMAHPADSIAAAELYAGGFSAPIQVAEVAGLILGTLLLCLTLWRARLAGPWPMLLFLVVLLAGGLPRGALQQSVRSLIVMSVAGWLAVSIQPSKHVAREANNSCSPA